MAWMLALLLIGVQDPEIDKLIKKLEEMGPHMTPSLTEALVAKGEAAEKALQLRIESKPDNVPPVLRSVLLRLKLQRRLLEIYPRPLPFDIEVENRPIAELIPDLERWIGMPLARDKMPEAKVTLRLKNVTALEALAAFHASSGVTWVLESDREYDPKRSLHVPLGDRARLVARPHSTWPASVSGRYRVVAGSVRTEESPAAGKGKAPSCVVGIGIEYSYLTRPSNLTSFTFEKIVDDRGRELQLEPNSAKPTYGPPRIGLGSAPPSIGRMIHCKVPEADARSISILGGKARAEFIVERTYVTFENPLEKVGTHVEAMGQKVTLKEFAPAHGWNRLILDQSGRYDMAAAPPVEPFEYRGLSLVEFVEIVHEDGHVSWPSTQGAQQEGPFYRKRMMCFATPKVKAIRLAYRTFVAYEDFTFELRDIPLPGVK